MKELACGWGIPQRLIITEDQSKGTRESIVNTLSLLKNNGVQSKTILFISAHLFPKRYLMLWQNYAKDVEFLPIGAFVIQGDDGRVADPQEESQKRIRRNDCVKELIKTAVTAVLIKTGVW